MRENIVIAHIRRQENRDGPVWTEASEAQGIMSEALDAMVLTLEGLGSPPENGALIEAIGRIYRLAHVSYYAPTIGYLPPTVFETTSPIERRGSFLAPEAAHSHATAGGFQFIPFEWSELPDRSCSRTINGFTVPLATPDGGGAVFSVADRSDETAWAERMKTARPEMLRLAEFVHRQALVHAGLSPEPMPLAPLELRMLQKLATNAEPSRIAAQLGLAEPTFRMVADSARHKLGALTTSHAISLAMNRGLI